MDGGRDSGRSARALERGGAPGADVIPIDRARRAAPRLVDEACAMADVRFVKLVDVARLEARFERGGWKQLPAIERRATWSRLLDGERARVGGGAVAFEKLPVRAKRLAKLRLFRSFKLLGPLKAGLDATRPVDAASPPPSMSERLRAIAQALRL